MLTDADIRRITSRIMTGYGPLLVGVFGSYAIGTAHEKSDLDLVVIKETAEQPLVRRRAVQRLLFGVLHPVDIQVFTPQEFEEAAHEQLSFAWVIARQVRIYHSSERAESCVPVLFRNSTRMLDVSAMKA